MSAPTARLRMFAGPNGSGKSTLKSFLPPALLGAYLNPDEIEQDIRTQGFLNCSAYGVSPTVEEMRSFFTCSTFLQAEGFADGVAKLAFAKGRVDFGAVKVNSYFASVAVDFLRQKLLEQKI